MTKRIKAVINRRRLAQSTIEYLLIFTAILGGIAASGLINRVRGNAFEQFFQKAIEKMR